MQYVKWTVQPSYHSIIMKEKENIVFDVVYIFFYAKRRGLSYHIAYEIKMNCNCFYIITWLTPLT